MTLLVFFLLCCRSIPPETEQSQGPVRNPENTLARVEELLKQADRGDIFEGSSFAQTPTIGILKPRGYYLSGDEQWIPDMIKSAMNNNFRKFASGRIMVMNVADEESLNEEIARSLLGSNDELSLTARMAARSLMTGSVIKIQGTTRFTVEFTVTDTETHAIIASYNQNHSDIEVIEGIAVNKATESLLKDLNVRLNEAGRYALYGASNEADTALAKGLSAAESGRGLQAMNYLFNAASYNTTASQASAPLVVVQSRNQRELQGAGSIVMDYFGRQELWQNRLNEFNNFYSSHAPFELFYTTPTPTNMRGTGDNRAYDLYFKIGLRWSQNQIVAMEKVLQEYILDGLNKNPQEDIRRWELKGLPDDSFLFKGPDNFKYSLLVNVENERGEIITSEPLILYGSLYRYQEKIYADCTQEFDAAFRNIKYNPDQMTQEFHIRIVSVNGININTIGESVFIRVSQGRELPAVQPNSLPRGLTSMMEREITTARRQQQAAATEAERQRQAKERDEVKASKERELAAVRNSFRIYLGAYGGPVLESKSGAINVNVGFGKSFFDLELGVMFYLNISDDMFKIFTNDEISIYGFNIGAYYTFVGRRWFLKLGPGLNLFGASNETISSSDYSFYFVPNLSAFFDIRVLSFAYLRLGYRFDMYDDELFPVFKGNSFSTIGSFFFTHNILFGLGFII